MYCIHTQLITIVHNVLQRLSKASFALDFIKVSVPLTLPDRADYSDKLLLRSVTDLASIPQTGAGTLLFRWCCCLEATHNNRSQCTAYIRNAQLSFTIYCIHTQRTTIVHNVLHTYATHYNRSQCIALGSNA